MARNTLFLFLCITLMLRLGSAVWLRTNCGPVDRPKKFRGAVENGFKRAHFGTTYVDAGTYGMSLNHVLSWKSIKEHVENGMQAAYTSRTRILQDRSRNNILNFINTLFSPDQYAYVRIFYDGRRPDGIDHLSK